MPTLKVAHRFLLASLLIVLLIAGSAWLVVSTNEWQAAQLAELRESALDANEHASAMSNAATTMHAAVQGYANALQSGGNAAPAESRVRELMSVFQRHLDASRAAVSSENRTAADRVDAIESAFTLYRQMVGRLGELPIDNAAVVTTPADRYATQVAPHYEETLAPLVARYHAATQTVIADHVMAANSARVWSGRFALGALGVLLIVVVLLTFTNVRYLDRNLKRSVSAARSVAAGRVKNTMRIKADDEFGDLFDALNALVSRLSTATVSKTYVENIVHSMADPLVVVDPDVRISMVNQALLDILGFESDELIGASVTKIFAHTGRQRGGAIKQDIERGLAGNIESMFRTKTGQEVSISLSSALVRASGEVQGLVIVAKDITEQKRRESELIEAKEEAERMVQLRDAFLANMSHEIRTPLTGILGSAQVLAGVVEGEHRNLARIIEDAGNRLLDTINSVLEMARIEAGEVQPEMEILDFAQEAEAVAAVLRPVAEKKGLTLRVYPPSKGRVAAQLDRSCLNRILNNLVGNAIKFTREGAISIEVSADEEHAILTVRDTGIGIEKDFIPYLFDDFKQESTGLRRSHEGSGLGLAITKKLIDMMGGTIEVESVKGLGSSFTASFVRVPVDEAAAAQHIPASRTSSSVSSADQSWASEQSGPARTFKTPPSAGERPWHDILLIEDNQQNAYMARFMLDGFTADVATTPEEALALVRQRQYGVLLVDINLGTDTSGIDLLREIRLIDGYTSTPSVAVTAYALPGDRERFLSEGFDDYVAKPYRRETLRGAVEKALAAHAPSEPSTDLDSVLGATFEDAANAEEMDAPARQPQESTPDPTHARHPAPAPAPRVDSPVPSRSPAPAPQPPPQFAEKPAPESASPDEFLPPDFAPGQTAFPPEVADLVHDAELRREHRDHDLHPLPTPEPLDDDVFIFVDLKPQGGAGDGADGPADAPRGQIDFSSRRDP